MHIGILYIHICIYIHIHMYVCVYVFACVCKYDTGFLVWFGRCTYGFLMERYERVHAGCHQPPPWLRWMPPRPWTSYSASTLDVVFLDSSRLLRKPSWRGYVLRTARCTSSSKVGDIGYPASARLRTGMKYKAFLSSWTVMLQSIRALATSGIWSLQNPFFAGPVHSA